MKAGSPAQRRRIAFDEVGSTNTLAFEAARADDPGMLWITAECQSAGRGRRGRAWLSERGNLYMSLLLLDPAPLADLGNLPLVVAVGVRNGIAGLAGIDDDRVRIKWPNDILVGGAKTVGILIESETLRSGRQAVVIGLGVNVVHWPDDAPYAVTGLRREGVEASLETIFQGIAAGVEAAIGLWDRGQRFAAVRRDWIRFNTGMGGPCRVNLPGGHFAEGRFADLDLQGRLVLERHDGVRETYSAGDLFLLPRAAQDDGAAFPHPSRP
ncbi:biotin--[acetyl-CoA-carboxylase] ligase [Aureimonas sp. AU12]|uniref:biotin--[acetyl-CoA-carboxylase] ligase n=1 Tax=Aureimonas sp. AU12 TaxID=1638161 RepID=UPI000781A034|nr:biotin--[acetyl-CoA-carboxylase] ligase [Aureimonas sp. AU12]